MTLLEIKLKRMNAAQAYIEFNGKMWDLDIDAISGEELRALQAEAKILHNTWMGYLEAEYAMQGKELQWYDRVHIR